VRRDGVAVGKRQHVEACREGAAEADS